MFDLGWVVGFLEGEGCFSAQKTIINVNEKFYPRVDATQNEIEPLEKLVELFGGSICRNGNNERCKRWVAYSKRAEEIMKLVYPYMSDKRQSKIEEISKVCGFEL